MFRWTNSVLNKLIPILVIARSWATPVRRIHATQHGDGGDDEIDFTEFRRNVSGRPIKESSKRHKDEKETIEMEVSLEKMINDYGFAPTNDLTLKSFVALQTESNREFDSPGIETAGRFSCDDNCQDESGIMHICFFPQPRFCIRHRSFLYSFVYW